MKIELSHVRKAYPNATPLKDINAVINEGDIISVIGPSGCGKSTLIRCINMIDPPTSGQIFLNGEDITDKKCDLSKVRQQIGMVFQYFNLFEHLTVVENVMHALTIVKKLTKQEAYDIAVAKLNIVGLGEKLMNYPDELSGGQKQRVCIARTLAMDPEVILLDEPTSALDPTMVREVEAVIKNLAKSGKTMMIVTHEMRLARAICNRVFYLDQGELYEDGTPEQIFDNPVRERTKAFIKHLKVFRYKFKSADFDLNEYNRKLNTFCINNDISLECYENANRFLGWFATELLPFAGGENHNFNIITEYSEENKSIKAIVYASALKNEKESIKEKLLEEMKKYDANASIEEIEDEDYCLKANCVLQEFLGIES